LIHENFCRRQEWVFTLGKVVNPCCKSC